MTEALRCAKEGLFINTDISRRKQDTTPFVQYWEYVRNNYRLKCEKQIGAQSANDIISFLKTYDRKYHYEKYE